MARNGKRPGKLPNSQEWSGRLLNGQKWSVWEADMIHVMVSE